MIDLSILNLSYYLSTVLYVISIIVILFSVIPLQAKEMKVKNGLVSLRRQLLARGVLSVIVSLVSVTLNYFLSKLEIPSDIQIILAAVVLLHAVSILLKSLIDYAIYHHQYSPVSQELHRQIGKLEDRQAARKADK